MRYRDSNCLFLLRNCWQFGVAKGKIQISIAFCVGIWSHVALAQRSPTNSIKDFIMRLGFVEMNKFDEVMINSGGHTCAFVDVTLGQMQK